MCQVAFVFCKTVHRWVTKDFSFISNKLHLFKYLIIIFKLLTFWCEKLLLGRRKEGIVQCKGQVACKIRYTLYSGEIRKKELNFFFRILPVRPSHKKRI